MKPLASELLEIRVKGKPVKVPALRFNDQKIIVTGKWLRVARIHDEEWLEGEVVKEPAALIQTLKAARVKVDLATFSQKIPDVQAKYDYPFEWDNVAVIPLSTFENWWEKRLPQESRKNVRRAGRRGVSVRSVAFDDELIRGITAIYNEAPLRQGIPFAHYGKGFETVKRETATLLDRSEFIGAFYQNELIGFIKLIYMGELASILHIVSMNSHYDKRPTNALLAKAIEICCQKSKTHLIYGKFTYGNKTNSSLTEFKDRNGFEKVLVPRYFVPLSIKGRIAVKSGLYRGWLGVLPPAVIEVALRLRAWAFQRILVRSRPGLQTNQGGPSDPAEQKVETLS
jgi:hypothetical protein